MEISLGNVTEEKISEDEFTIFLFAFVNPQPRIFIPLIFRERRREGKKEVNRKREKYWCERHLYIGCLPPTS